MEERDYEAKQSVYAETPERIGGSKLPLSQQEKAIAELHMTIEDLIQRLSPILTPVEAKLGVNPNDSTTQPIESPLATQLNDNNSGIRRASNNLRGIMERLEC